MYHSKGGAVWLDSPESSIAYCVSTTQGSPGVAGMVGRVCTLEHVSWLGWRRGCLLRRTPSEPSPAWTLPCQPEQAGGLQAKCSQNLHLWWMVVTLKTASLSSSLTIEESILKLPLVGDTVIVNWADTYLSYHLQTNCCIGPSSLQEARIRA